MSDTGIICLVFYTVDDMEARLREMGCKQSAIDELVNVVTTAPPHGIYTIITPSKDGVYPTINPYAIAHSIDHPIESEV